MLAYFQKLYSKKAETFYELVATNLQKKQKMFIITANPETFTYGKNDPLIDKMLKDEISTLIPDGIGIVKSASMLGFKIPERITGIDLASALLKMADDNKYKVALLGAKEEVMTSLKEVIKEKYPNINLVKTANGYISNKDDFFTELIPLKPDIVLVALGIPNQEKLIYQNISKFDQGIFVGVGGSFDVLSGTKKRAPVFFQKLNIEWLYRIVKEPSRLKRFWQNNCLFLFKVRKLKKTIKKTKTN